MPQLMRRDAERQRLHPALLDQPVRVDDGSVGDVLAEVVAGACRPGGGNEHWIVWAGPLARGLVFAEDLPREPDRIAAVCADLGISPERRTTSAASSPSPNRSALASPNGRPASRSP